MTPAVLSMLLMLAALSAASDSVPADPCAARKPGASITAFVTMPPIGARDTVVNTAVCVLPAKSGTVKFGSYHGELYFDSTAARVLRVEKPAGGMRVENTRLAGQVNFAGAAPAGFASGALLRVTLRVKKPGMRPRLRLKMLELNGTDGSNLMQQLVTTP
jgi:hypothetical protein